MGKLAPAFALPDLTGRIHRLSDYAGKAIWLEFWVTWCASCQETLPQKDILYRTMNHPGLVFLTIHVSGRESNPDRVFSFMEQNGFQFPVLRDNGRETYDAYGLQSVPSSVLINNKGEIHGIFDETVPFTSVIKEIGNILPAP
ncbi:MULTISPECIES: TlpA disulfide reductase family protein [Thermoactinomyces]|uniref:TlpA family protein disulfide reductase n=1 Tax=Thermoactinomyces daqus TaxID=1329516 RepID=A0A7W2AK18_9BACL|nr:TlpA disulfide reductase family protein [Thermoactinomyces daqus]MBA4544468.1 TlpA family protein disulfide reductase [Thermoactinomyces daqus]MBH8599039.1 TlpA family protein disulfide reductase [Thermoactinomyces sp. CICC 10523]MBH8605026.1 TlpA family protein disulfide reductase [Thermoactinomyces sp. CICC 10522]MBH8608466.1 TlpA family protein disulfide reductase [Thermoactinomyces sp. CICC 10521]